MGVRTYSLEVLQCQILWTRGGTGPAHVVGSSIVAGQSSRPRLGRVVVWSHIQVFYHASKDSRVGTVPLYGSKGYPYSRVPTDPLAN
jgi:hypothetical protein